MNSKWEKDYEHFCESVRRQVPVLVDSMDAEALAQAATLISDAKRGGHRLHVTGI